MSAFDPFLPFFSVAGPALGAIGVFLLQSTRNPKSERFLSPVALTGVVLSAASSFLWALRTGHVPIDGLVRPSALTPYWLLGISLVILLGFLAVRLFAETPSQRERLYLLAGLSGTGALSLAAANNWIIVVTAWQLSTLPVILVNRPRMSHPRPGDHSALSFFFSEFFAFSLSILGIALLFAQYQTLDLSDLAASVAAEAHDSDILLYTGMALWFAGAFARLGILPFHLVALSRTHTSSLAITGLSSLWIFLSTVAFCWNLVGNVLAPALPQWQDFLHLLAIVSIAAGSMGMLVRPRFETVYSLYLTVLAGWVLLALAAGGTRNLETESFFLTISQSMALAILLFGYLIERRNQGSGPVTDFHGLLQGRPWFGFAVFTACATLATIPPTLGFSSYIGVLSRLAGSGHSWLAVLSGIFAVVAAYPFMRWTQNLLAPEKVPRSWVEPARREVVLLWILAIGLWALGIAPSIAWPG